MMELNSEMKKTTTMKTELIKIAKEIIKDCFFSQNSITSDEVSSNYDLSFINNMETISDNTPTNKNFFMKKYIHNIKTNAARILILIICTAFTFSAQAARTFYQ
jgi:hypothetical protein